MFIVDIKQGHVPTLYLLYVTLNYRPTLPRYFYLQPLSLLHEQMLPLLTYLLKDLVIIA